MGIVPYHPSPVTHHPWRYIADFAFGCIIQFMKPYVICHMCTSVDGKILGDRWGKLPGTKSSVNLFETTAASFGIGSWLVGTTTMDEFDGRKTKLPVAPKH